MVIDTSALVAILSAEPEYAALIHTIEQAEPRLISAATWLETSIVIDSRYGPPGVLLLDRFLQRADFEIVSVDIEQVTTAREAYRAFGKGRHPAGLNFGDCFAYALAITRKQPLLYKGNDFIRTDVETLQW